MGETQQKNCCKWEWTELSRVCDSMVSISVACLLMCVLFHFSFVCLHVCAYASIFKVHCGSAFEPGASGLPHYCTTPVCSILNREKVSVAVFVTVQCHVLQCAKNTLAPHPPDNAPTKTSLVSDNTYRWIITNGLIIGFWLLGWLIHEGAICTRIAPLWISTSNGTAWSLIWRSQVRR